MSMSYRSPTTQHLSDLELSRSLNVKSNGAIRFPINDFLFMFNSNLWPN